jgi:hypothetical protein
MIPDLEYLAAVVGFFALTWGFMKLCEILQRDSPRGNS